MNEQEAIKPLKKYVYVFGYNVNSKCWFCFAQLDFEEIFFDNQCPYCFASQDYDIIDFGSFGW